MHIAYNRNGDIIAKHENYDMLLHELKNAGYSRVDFFITPAAAPEALAA